VFVVAISSPRQSVGVSPSTERSSTRTPLDVPWRRMHACMAARKSSDPSLGKSSMPCSGAGSTSKNVPIIQTPVVRETSGDVKQRTPTIFPLGYCARNRYMYQDRHIHSLSTFNWCSVLRALITTLHRYDLQGKSVVLGLCRTVNLRKVPVWYITNHASRQTTWIFEDADA
jgi:hypothetical protein